MTGKIKTGCEYCQPPRYSLLTSRFCCRICVEIRENNLRILDDDNADIFEDFPIAYCPKCGRKLECQEN